MTYGGERYTARTRDVSLGGMFVYTHAKPPFGTNITLQVTFPHLKNESTIETVVRWHQLGGIGLSFKSLRALEVWALNQLFKKGLSALG